MGSTRSASTPLADVTLHDHNWNGYENGNADMRTLLRDPDNLDLRPIPNSVLVDGGAHIAGITDAYTGTAPDIGAYEHGVANYWIPGRQETAASMAIPPHGSTTAKASASLIWLPGLDSLSSEVYLGSSSNAVATATTNSAEYVGNQVNNIYDPLGLQAQSYFWRIDENTATGIVSGAVWNFTVPTASVTAPGINNTPASGITNFAATIGGQITDGGTGSKVWIYWWTDGGGTNVIDMGIHAGAFSTNLTGLSGNTLYNYRCYAENSYGTTWASGVETFVLGVLEEVPALVNTPATNITAGTATIGGEITNGVESATVWIQWWADGGATNVVDLGSQTDVFSTALSGLAPATLHYFQCQASNAYGSAVIPPANSFTTLAVGSTNWIELTYDDFESGFGNFTSGGVDAFLHSGAESHQGSYSVGIRDDKAEISSIYHTAPIDADTPGYTAVKIEFWFYPHSMEVAGPDNFFLQYYNGTSWVTLRDYVSGVDFTNGNFQFESVLVDEAVYTLPPDLKVRFMCDANGQGDYVYIDEVRVSALGSAAPPIAPYEVWWNEYGLSGSDTNYLTDSDDDGMNNLMEYGLGGNPTNDDAAAVQPVFADVAGPNMMEYVYRRRTDAEARGLDYWLELNTNLVSATWNTNGYTETGAAPIETGFEAVTNEIYTTETNRFIRLRISID
jgi:hypothetical protein